MDISINFINYNYYHQGYIEILYFFGLCTLKTYKNDFKHIKIIYIFLKKFENQAFFHFFQKIFTRLTMALEDGKCFSRHYKTFPVGFEIF